MTATRTFAAALATIIMTLQASACCLFPLFPTYAPACGPGYGWGYRGFGIAPAYYSSGYYGSSNCCSPCTTSCCPTTTCGSTCSNCVPTEVRNKAVPDPISNERADDAGGEKTFRGGGYDDDANPGAAEDDFGRGGYGSGSGAAGGVGNVGADGQKKWEPSGDGASGSGTGTRTPFGLDGDIPGRGGFGSNRPPLDGLNGGAGAEGSGSGGAESGVGAGTGAGGAGSGTGAGVDENGIINHSANKAPINLPLHEETASDGEGDNGADADQGTDEADDEEEQSGQTEDSSGTNAEVDPGAETNANEFLGPEGEGDDSETDATSTTGRQRLFSQRDIRSSHFGVLSMQRLARKAAPISAARSMISSSRKKQRPVRWISLPAPDGRVRS